MVDIVDRRSQSRRYDHDSMGRNRFVEPEEGRFVRTRGADVMARVDAIVLHQTGIAFADRHSREDGFDRVIAHFVVLGTGRVLWLLDLDAFLSVAHTRKSITIEFEGKFPESRDATDVPTVRQLIAGRELIDHLRAGNMGLAPNQLTKIFAHRQINPTDKPNCCGPHIWCNVGRWAIESRGMSSVNPPGATGNIPAGWLDKARWGIL